MSRDRVFEEQPLRCMANYYDYGPPASSSPTIMAYPRNIPRRSILEPMASYTDQYRRNISTKHGQPRKTSHEPGINQEAGRMHLEVDLQATDTDHKKFSMTDSTLENDIDREEMTELNLQYLSPLIVTCSDEDTWKQPDDNPYWKIRKQVEIIKEKFRQRLRRSRFYGWRMGVLLGTCVSLFVLFCNIAVVVIGSQTETGYDQDGVATVMEGSESTVSAWNTVCHVFINVLSTVLLSASNYTMQVLNAPTRQEIDKAHRQGKWLDIGVLSIHNLRIISPKRAALCLVLAASSLPLHLFYNASIFKIIAMRDFQIVLLDRNSTFFNTTRLSTNQTDITGLRSYGNTSITSVRMDNNQWTKIYNAPKITRYGDLYLVVDQISWKTSPDVTDHTFKLLDYFPANITGPTFFNAHNPSGEGWAPFILLPNSTDPTRPESMHIQEGWTTETDSKSRIQISLYFMVVVILFNFVKLTIMVTALMMDTSEYVVTLGDAAASYLEFPEELTENRGALEMDRILVSFGSEDTTDYSKILWQPRLRRYCSSIGYDKAWTAITAGTCLVLVIVVFPTRIDAVDAGIWNWGSASGGSLSFGSRAGTTKGTIWNAWLANTPQVLLSLCYLNMNTICTSMASAAEWNKLATSRKGLRVTKPHGSQRSTYFLQLPYKFATPLIFASGGLHWLLSQTFFLSRFDYYSRDGKLDRWISACGISFSSLVTFCVSCAILVIAVRWVGRRRMVPNLPLAENCSLMVSAACHPAPDEANPHLAKVQWGIISSTGCCSLSSKDVEQPETRKL